MQLVVKLVTDRSLMFQSMRFVRQFHVEFVHLNAVMVDRHLNIVRSSTQLQNFSCR